MKVYVAENYPIIVIILYVCFFKLKYSRAIISSRFNFSPVASSAFYFGGILIRILIISRYARRGSQSFEK